MRYGTRTHLKQVWFSDEEMLILEKLLSKTTMNLSEYIRSCCLNKEIREKPDDRFYEILKPMRSISNNINQLTAKAHSLGYIDELSYQQDKERLDEVINDIRRKYL